MHWADGLSDVVNCLRKEATFFELDGSINVAKERDYAANVYDMSLRGSFVERRRGVA